MTPFVSFDVEIRKVICNMNAIESVNARIHRAVRARGHFPMEAAALKSVDAFQIAFDDRLTYTDDNSTAKISR